MSLFIDTSNFRLIIAIVDEENNKILTICNEKMNGDLSTKIFPLLDECIRNAGIKPDDIKKIYSVVGPGSFTGVRIGVTICKTFAWAKKINVYPISSLEVIASSNKDADYAVAMIDARRGAVYGAIYDKNLFPVLTDSYISLESLSNNLPEGNINYYSDDQIDYFENVKESDPDILRIINLHKNDNPVNPHNLNPVYLKMTEAEANLLSKKND